MSTTISWRREFTRLNATNKIERVATAEFAARHWRSHSDTDCSARCTVCGEWIYTLRRLVQGELETWGTALVGALFEHLADECALVLA